MTKRIDMTHFGRKVDICFLELGVYFKAST